jgi:DNA-binding response OmpR family regulator
MTKILIVDDDQALQETLALTLQGEGFQVISERDGAKGLDRASKDKPDLVILDLSLPSLDGFELLKRLRSKGNFVPVIVLTGRKKEEMDRILGLELGADDYVLKPFGPRELVARVHAVLRRGRGEPEMIEACRFGDVALDFKAQTATRAAKDLHLTAKEFSLLRFLITHEGEVVSRESILNQVWGYEKFPSTRTVDTFVHNLRQKIEDDPAHPRHLITVAWSGYKFQK